MNDDLTGVAFADLPPCTCHQSGTCPRCVEIDRRLESSSSSRGQQLQQVFERRKAANARHQARRAARQPIASDGLPQLPRGHWRSDGHGGRIPKAKYDTEEAAERDNEKLHPHGHAYLCAYCWKWHWTSQPKRAS